MSWISTNNLRRFADKLFHGNLSFGGSVTHNGATTFNGGVKVNTIKAEFAAPVSFTGTTTYKGNEIATVTGTGASGTWGISISGTAAKATADASGNNIANTYATKANTYTKAEVDNKLSGGSNILEKMYPVGSIYMNATDSRNPAQIFGFGTWEQISAGRVLLGAGTADSGTVYNAGGTGGEEKTLLSIDEIPSHTHLASMSTAGQHSHSVTIYSHDTDEDTSGVTYSYGRPYYNRDTNYAGNHTHLITINNTGGSTPHNNMQPYLVVYIFKRTA